MSLSTAVEHYTQLRYQDFKRCLRFNIQTRGGKNTAMTTHLFKSNLLALRLFCVSVPNSDATYR